MYIYFTTKTLKGVDEEATFYCIFSVLDYKVYLVTTFSKFFSSSYQQIMFYGDFTFFFFWSFLLCSPLKQ